MTTKRYLCRKCGRDVTGHWLVLVAGGRLHFLFDGEACGPVEADVPLPTTVTVEGEVSDE